MDLHRKQGTLTVVLSLLLLPVCGAMGHAESNSCSQETLKGDYGFTITGQIISGPAAGPVTGVAKTHFDGEGNLKQVDHVVHNGNLPAEDWRPATGTYSVNDDCTGAAQINFTDGSPSLNLRFVLVKDGEEIRTVVSNPGTAITSIGIRP